MIKKLTVTILVLLFSSSLYAEFQMERVICTTKKISNCGAYIYNTKTGEVAFIVANVGFHFEKPLMEEHFNENYMESDKYKTSVFKGTIIGNVDYTKDGKYPVKVKGILKMHGVEKEREIDGEINIKDSVINVVSEFSVDLKDHKIKIPKLVVKNIAETVKVTVNINFALKK